MNWIKKTMNNRKWFHYSSRIITLLLLSAIFFKCSDASETIHEDQSLIDFKGLKVNHGKRDIAALENSIDDYKNMYLNQYGKSNGRIVSTLESLKYPSLDELALIEEEKEQAYPDVYSMEDEDIERVKQDFPMLSDREISENIDLIAEYYDKNLLYDVFQEIISSPTNQRSSSNSRVAYDYPYELCSKEFWYLSVRPRAAITVKDATNKTWEFYDSIYPKRTTSTRADAFRHGLWNVLIAKYYSAKRKSVSKGLELAREFTNKHEECNAEDGTVAYDQVGRDYFKSVATIKKKRRRFWFPKQWLDAPSDEAIRNVIKSKTDIALKVSKSVHEVQRANRGSLVYFQ